LNYDARNHELKKPYHVVSSKLPAPGGSEGNPGPDCFAFVCIFFGNTIRNLVAIIVLTGLEVSSHFTHGALCLVSVLVPLSVRPCKGDGKKILLGPEPAVGGPGAISKIQYP